MCTGYFIDIFYKTIYFVEKIIVSCLDYFFGCVACGILVPRPGIEPVPPAVEAWSPNHWTVREFPIWIFFCNLFLVFKLSHLFGNLLAVQWLGLHAFTAKGPGSILGQGTKILQAARPGQ